MITDPAVPIETRIFLFDNFGTCFQAYISMFELTMWPGAIAKYRRLYEEVHPLIALFFVGYSIIVTFAVVRVITAMFLKATLAASNADEGHEAKLKENRRMAYVENLKLSMQNPACGGSLLLNKEELTLVHALPRMQEWLDDVGFSSLEQEILFEALDIGSGQISYDAFIVAIERMSGKSNMNTDVVVHLYHSRKTQRHIEDLLTLCLRRLKV